MKSISCRTPTSSSGCPIASAGLPRPRSSPQDGETARIVVSASIQAGLGGGRHRGRPSARGSRRTRPRPVSAPGGRTLPRGRARRAPPAPPRIRADSASARLRSRLLLAGPAATAVDGKSGGTLPAGGPLVSGRLSAAVPTVVAGRADRVRLPRCPGGGRRRRACWRWPGRSSRHPRSAGGRAPCRVATRQSFGRPWTLITPEPTNASTGVTGTVRPTAADSASAARLASRRASATYCRALAVDLHDVAGDQNAGPAVVGDRDGVDAAGADGQESGAVVARVRLVVGSSVRGQSTMCQVGPSRSSLVSARAPAASRRRASRSARRRRAQSTGLERGVSTAVGGAGAVGRTGSIDGGQYSGGHGQRGTGGEDSHCDLRQKVYRALCSLP